MRATALEQQIAAEFELAARGVVTKARTILGLPVQPEIQAGRIPPTIHPVRQLAQGLRLAQAQGQLVERFKIAAARKTFALLDPWDGLLASLALDPLMAVEADLHVKWRMAAHLDGQLSPVRIQDVKVIMLHRLPRRLPAQDQFARAISFGFPNQGRGARTRMAKTLWKAGAWGGSFSARGCLVLSPNGQWIMGTVCCLAKA